LHLLCWLLAFCGGGFHVCGRRFIGCGFFRRCFLFCSYPFGFRFLRCCSFRRGLFGCSFLFGRSAFGSSLFVSSLFGCLGFGGCLLLSVYQFGKLSAR
jgi:hypothetical protein